MKNSRFFLIFALFWSALVLIFDVVCARGLIGQWRSEGFRAAPGRILSSEITSDSDGEGTTYGAKIRFQYRVGDHTYESDRVRYWQVSTSDGRWAYEAVETFPADAACTVYYDPRDPGLAVLQRGVSGQDLFITFFLTPFNAVMLLVWGGLLSAWRPRAAGGATVSVQPDRIEVRFAKFPPAGVGLITAGGLALVLIFAVGFSSGFSPSLPVMIAAWAAMLAAGLGAFFFWKGKKPANRPPDVVIDAAQGTLTIPAAALVVPLGLIRGVEVRERGTSRSSSHVAALLVATGPAGETRETDVGSWMFASGAESFVRWLRETLGLAGQRPAPGS